MLVSTLDALPAGDRDTVAIAIAAGLPSPAPYGALLDAAIARREVRTQAGHVAVLHDGDTRLITVGIGDAAAVDPEALRVGAAHVSGRAGSIGTKTLHWLLPELALDPAAATAALIEGTILRGWSYKTAIAEEPAEDALHSLLIVGGDADADAAEAGRLIAEAANWARLQQHEPPNVLTPRELGRRAERLADDLASPHLEIEVGGREWLAERKMGALLAVAQGSVEEPVVITARYRHPAAKGPRIGLVGKAVTFDSGGISIKPGARMHEMKFDMSGGAVVLGVLQAVVALDLPLDLVVVVGSTENLPSGNAYKPGDIITAADGTTIEITNTDAEGRLVLADCLWHARQEGAEQLVDVATLTGAVTVALGSTHAGLIASDDALATALLQAAERTGELAWRLPLHPEYAKLMQSPDAELVNGSLERKAGTITGGYFLSRFAGDVPWAHLDIAGTAWGLNRAYVGRGGSAYGLRLLVDWLRAGSHAA